MSKQEILNLPVKPEEIGPLLLALRPLVCVVCGTPFRDHMRKGHLFLELLESDTAEEVFESIFEGDGQ